MGKSRKKDSGKKGFTSRERTLHHVLARAAWNTLLREDVDGLAGKKMAVQKDLLPAVASLSLERLRRLGGLIRKRVSETDAIVRKREDARYLGEHLALQLVWFCLGDGRNNQPPNPLPSELDVTLHPYIYAATAELIGDVATRAGSGKVLAGKALDDRHRRIQAVEECERLQKENEFLRQQLDDTKANREEWTSGAVREAIEQFAIDVIARLGGRM